MGSFKRQLQILNAFIDRDLDPYNRYYLLKETRDELDKELMKLEKSLGLMPSRAVWLDCGHAASAHPSYIVGDSLKCPVCGIKRIIVMRV